ncbi:MAG: hypothetical protein JJE18_03950 [Eubacteriaceae bacterium]|nr:hypothetical protein [Eubacteriaceae bacterium]
MLKIKSAVFQASYEIRQSYFSDYAIKADTVSGDKNLPFSTNGNKLLNASTTSGDIDIAFTPTIDCKATILNKYYEIFLLKLGLDLKRR